jgi:hypothetical protein
MIMRGVGNAAVAVAAAGALVVLAGCSSDPAPAVTPSTTSAAAAAAAAPTPTAQQLDQQVRTVLDPSVPNDQKLQFIQGVSADPELPNKLAEAYQKGNATLVVTSVQSTGPDSASATAEFTFAGQAPNQAAVPVVYENGTWKIEHSWACNALVNLNVSSPACP